MKHSKSIRILLLLAALLSCGTPLLAETRIETAEPEPQQPAPALPSPTREVVIAVRAPEPRVSEDKVGSFPVHEGQTLRLTTDTGNIRIKTQDTNQLSYTMRVEANAKDADAKRLLHSVALTARSGADGVSLAARVSSREARNRVWVTFDVEVPRTFQLDISTLGGSIETAAINGRVTLHSQGGDLRAASIGGPARLETVGGHVTVQDVDGELVAITAGGHVHVGTVKGPATIRTGGGHIRVSRVDGNAQLETGGGNIFLASAGGLVNVSTSGGRIDLGEIDGSLRARTGGGSIGILKVAGTTQLESSGGGICLPAVQGPVQASTTRGPITVWFAPQTQKLSGPSQLITGQGDIVVFLSRQIPVTVEAQIESPAEHRIEWQEGIPVKVSATAGAARPVRAEAAVNGGGDVLKLKTVSGNILLRYADVVQARWQQMDAPALQVQQLKLRMEAQRKQIENQIKQQLFWASQDAMTVSSNQELQAVQTAAAARQESAMQVWRRRFAEIWPGGSRVAHVERVPSSEQHARLVYSIRPSYPLQARERRIEGRVQLELRIAANGQVESVRVLNGHPLLAPEAVQAVRQWRYAPHLVDGQPVPVVTSLDVDFRLP